jgi:hypothetical protein
LENIASVFETLLDLAARVAQWLEWKHKDLVILASPVQIPL